MNIVAAVGRPTCVRLLAGGLLLALLGNAPRTSIAQSAPALPGPLPAEARAPLSEIPGAPAAETQPAARVADAPGDVRELYLAALDFIDEENFVLAEVRLDAAIAAAPDDYYDLYYEAARVKLRLRGPFAARGPADRAVELRPAGADPRYLLGEICEQLGELNAAVTHFRTATLAAETELNNPRVTAAWFRVATLLERTGFLTAAEEAYARFDDAIWESHVEHRTAAEVAPLLTRNPGGAVELRLALLERLGRVDDAVRVAATAAERDPDSPELARQHARALLAAGRAVEALDLCRRRLATSQPGAGQTAPAGGFLWLAVDAARAAGALDRWLAEVVSAIQNGQRPEVARTLAGILERAGAADKAVELLAALCDAAPDDPGIAWALARARRAAGQYDRSFTALAAFLRTTPSPGDVPGESLRAWMRPSPTPPAYVEAVAAAGQRADRDFATSFVIATAAAAAEQTALAESLLGQSLADRPDYAPAAAARAELALSAFRWEEAQRHAEAAANIAPGYAVALRARAEAAAGLDENDVATQAYKEAIRAAPNEALYRLALAEHMRRMGDLTAAQRYYQEALTLDASSAVAAEGLVTSYVEEHKHALAKQQLVRAELSDLPEDALRRMRTTVRYAEVRFQAEHLAELQRQSAAHPQDGETALTLAVGLFIRGRIDDAAAAIQRTRQTLEQDPRVLVLAGRIHAMQLDYDRSIAAYEVLRQRYPNRGSMLRMLAEAYLDDFRTEDGRAVLRQLIEQAQTEDDRDALRLTLVRNYEEHREYDAALRVLDERPNHDLFVLTRIGLLRRATRYREALEAAAAWLKAAPDNIYRREEYIRSAIAARQFDDALARVTEWRSAVPEDTGALHLSIRLLIAARRAEDGLKLLNELRPTDLNVDFHRRVLLARCKAAAGNLPGALAELDALLGERALARGAYLDECRAAVLELCNKYNAPDEALQRLAAWRAAEPDGGADQELVWLLRERSVLSAANRLDECIDVMERLLERLTADADQSSTLFFGLNNDLGYMLVDRGKEAPRATAMIRRALASQPRNSAYLDSFGWALYKAGDFAGAVRYIGRAVSLASGQDAVLYDHLGDAQQRLGDSSAARRSWERTVALILDDAERMYQFENEHDDITLPAPVELLAQVRAKLEALERGTAPPVAPLAPNP